MAESRGARRKRETRERLLSAAYQLFADRGLDAVAINEITEAADVGFGSFYNHFESKEDIYRAVCDTFEQFADALDRAIAGLTDPAEVVAVSIRHTLMRALREPAWGRLLVREGLGPQALTRGLGMRLARDVGKGVASGRFKIPDPEMTIAAIGGGVLAAVGSGFAGPSNDTMPARMTEVLLHSLGLTFTQASTLVKKPLPAI